MMKSTDVREHIITFLSEELIGPFPGLPAIQLNGEEILRAQDPPRLRYGAGILFPMKAAVYAQYNAAEEEIQFEEAGVVGESKGSIDGELQSGLGDPKADVRGESQPETDQEINLANEYLPSAMGLSALIKMPRSLRLKVAAGHYKQQELKGAGRFGKDGNYIRHMAWWRIPIEAEIHIDCTPLIGDGTKVTEIPVVINESDIGLHIHIVSRPFLLQSFPQVRIITLTLINRKVSRSNRPKDDECFFQCGFEVIDGAEDGCFLEYPEKPGEPEDDEEASLRLLYRNKKIFAIGHGCSANWGAPENSVSKKIWTESLPLFDVKPILPVEIFGLNLSMLLLSDEFKKEPIEICNELANKYRAWIENEEAKINNAIEIPSNLNEVAKKLLTKCWNLLSRMQYGISLLEKNDVARKAFALMNKAMLMQQIHYKISSQTVREWRKIGAGLGLEQPYTPPSYDDITLKWRPFQLAFILMNLRSLLEVDSEERETVDLIWFPTGGGKTEAYLGLAAFSIFLRRLINAEDCGTTVLMRYTLRLLTTQQYQRAASLICACEKLRRADEKRLGTTPISIGLWVGGDVTPNKNNDAVNALNRLLTGEQRENPFIILSCPWCGAQMGPVKCGNHIECKGYILIKHPSRVIFRCEDPGCDFDDQRGLPLKVVDEAIYADPPTLLVGTVDKFALLPWNPEAKSLFGLESNDKYSPPYLIIQDELHLISGPLGSMVGHYETAIDALCMAENSYTRYSPKIVASTATISRADEQIRALYGREQYFLFPPQGLEAGNSFFAKEISDQPGRTYVGVFASGLPSHVTAQIRVISALLESIKTAPTSDPDLLDPYWTLMAYFNSLRELGHAATLIRADIREYLNAMWDRLGFKKALTGDEGAAKRRFINIDLELTSRIQSCQITEILQQLFIKYDGSTKYNSVDICLATNMIQVGLDIPRLSIMTVVGQPKTTSEYIQATSRVGRTKPGLIVTVYNPSKPRDRSHYEHFRAYHESFYRYVEPTSVTPFAIPVRERALHALIVTLVRFWGQEQQKKSPFPPPPKELLDKIRTIILDRVSTTDPAECEETDIMFNEIIDSWQRIQPSRYGDFGPPTGEIPLMYPSGNQRLPEWNELPFATPSSMRNVDANCDANIITLFPEPLG